MPAETHLSILAMVLGGVFDRVPRICGSASPTAADLRVLARPHGQRLAPAPRHRPGRREHPPSHYVGRFSVDSVVFDAAPLRLLVDTLGEDQVMVGSDYPYPLGERPAGAVVAPPTSSPTSSSEKLLTRAAVQVPRPDLTRLASAGPTHLATSPRTTGSRVPALAGATCGAFDSARAGRGPAKRRHVTGSEAVTRGPVPTRFFRDGLRTSRTGGPERRHQADPHALKSMQPSHGQGPDPSQPFQWPCERTFFLPTGGHGPITGGNLR